MECPKLHGLSAGKTTPTDEISDEKSFVRRPHLLLILVFTYEKYF